MRRRSGGGQTGENWDRAEKIPEKKKVVVGGGGSSLFGPLTQGSIVLLGNEGTKETGGVHLILAGGRSLRSRETPPRSFICCGVSLGRH